MDDYAVRPNLDVSGVGSASGGVYQNVTIQGVSKIHHDIDCLRCDLEGVAEILGHVRAQVLSVQGKAKIQGDVVANEVVVEGVTRISGGVFAESLSLTGVLCVGGSCETERFEAHGMFVIEGLLSADEILLRLERSSRVKEIGGAQIRVVRSKGSRFFQRVRRLTAEVIEGDDIYLEYTKANVVRGKRVTLGPGTEVNLLEYSSDFEKIGDAFVERHKKL
ncbi:hypothetical protein [Alicyclobacillus suci]|uniref:hypothetical protein n=1 Tax=Alicyclobacillus suci TaxID=2816080 RepID=UPI001A8CD820|nr:hypothetical protein [Alicyclobacillus suci]